MLRIIFFALGACLRSALVSFSTRHPALPDQSQRFGVCIALRFEHAGGERFLACPSSNTGTVRCKMIGPWSYWLSTKMYGATAYTRCGLQHRFVYVPAVHCRRRRNLELTPDGYLLPDIRNLPESKRASKNPASTTMSTAALRHGSKIAVEKILWCCENHAARLPIAGIPAALAISSPPALAELEITNSIFASNFWRRDLRY